MSENTRKIIVILVFSNIAFAILLGLTLKKTSDDWHTIKDLGDQIHRAEEIHPDLRPKLWPDEIGTQTLEHTLPHETHHWPW